jgi:cell division protein FtsB
MNVDYGIWSKLTRVVVFLIVVAAILLVFNWYLPLIQQNERMRKDILSLENQIRQEQETSKELRAEIDAMRTDPKTVERIARDKFGYAKPDETIVRFDNAATNPIVAH